MTAKDNRASKLSLLECPSVNGTRLMQRKSPLQFSACFINIIFYCYSLSWREAAEEIKIVIILVALKNGATCANCRRCNPSWARVQKGGEQPGWKRGQKA